MNILIVFSSVAEHSGLHDNIFDTALEGKRRGHNVFVAYRSGEFYDKLKRNGINVIDTDCKLRGKSCKQIKVAMNAEIDLIHTHPGDGRKVALMLSKELKVPLVMTIHGKWTNSLSNYIEDVDAVFAVSEGIRQKVIEECKGHYEKVFVIPNSYTFPLIKNEIREKLAIISIITRLDKDKQLVLSVIQNFIDSLNTFDDELLVNIIGDGTEKETVQDYVSKNLNNKNISIEFRGWINNKEILKDFYLKSDLIIGPGRVIIDAYSLNIPAIVVGSKRYEGLISKENWTSLVSSNFGGYKHNDIDVADESGMIKDFKKIKSYEYRKDSSDIGYKVVEEFFNKENINNKIFSIYDVLKN